MLECFCRRRPMECASEEFLLDVFAPFTLLLFPCWPYEMTKEANLHLQH